MFGYIRIYKPYLRFYEYERYKSVYCTLCKQMGKRYGIFAKLLLNYDYTFVAMLMLELEHTEISCGKGRCTFNPLYRCPKCVAETGAFELTAALTAIMFYHKLRDNINDSSFFGRIGWRLMKFFAAPMRRKARKSFPELDALVTDYIDEQQSVESSDNASVDSAAEPSARLISSLAVMLTDDVTVQPILSKFGYYLGRWIYLIDAQDDLEKDIKKKRFNPFALKFSLGAEDVKNKSEALKSAHIYANETMNLTMSAMLDYYDVLRPVYFKEVLDNITLIGMSYSQKSAMHLEDAAHKGV